jgi:arabinofuranosyltransferase
MAYSRFLLVATVFAATLGAVGVGMLVDQVATRVGTGPGVGAGALVVVALVVWHAHRSDGRWRADMGKSTGWLEGKWEGVATMDRFARVRVAAGAAFRDRVPPETLVTVGAAGAMPYASGLQTMDAFGLVDPGVAALEGIKPAIGKRARPGHQLYAPAAYVKSRDPDLLCHVGSGGEKQPGSRHAASAFRRGYTWACVEYDRILDDRDPDGTLDPGGLYCCRRPVSRTVGSFGVEESP